MSLSALLWIIIFSIAALLFFSTATIIAIKGAKDLRDLLKVSRRKVE